MTLCTQEPGRHGVRLRGQQVTGGLNGRITLPLLPPLSRGLYSTTELHNSNHLGGRELPWGSCRRLGVCVRRSGWTSALGTLEFRQPLGESRNLRGDSPKERPGSQKKAGRQQCEPRRQSLTWRCPRSLPTQGCPGACHMQNRFPPTSGHPPSRDLSQPRATHPTAGATGFPIFNKNLGPPAAA